MRTGLLYEQCTPLSMRAWSLSLTWEDTRCSISVTSKSKFKSNHKNSLAGPKYFETPNLSRSDAITPESIVSISSTGTVAARTPHGHSLKMPVGVPASRSTHTTQDQSTWRGAGPEYQCRVSLQESSYGQCAQE
jgi:hypothetical protein